MQLSQGVGILSGRIAMPRQAILSSESDLDEFLRRLSSSHISTICIEGRCPNRGLCFPHRHISVLILGDVCTRNCRFCSVKKGAKGGDFSWEEEAICSLVREADIRSLVITSVTRDDLPDYGAGHFTRIVRSLKDEFPYLKIELLIPDFMAQTRLLDLILELPVEIIGHNIETVKRLYPVIRPNSDFDRSLSVISYLSKHSPTSVRIKTSFMLGLGEKLEDARQLIQTLAQTGVEELCIGQYLSPGEGHFKVSQIYDKIDFEELAGYARSLGVKRVMAGPFVRSSFSIEEGRNGVKE